LLLFLFSVPLAAPALMIGDCNDGTVIRQLLWLYLLGWCLLICIAALCVLSSKELRQAVNVAWRRVLIGLVVLDIFVGGMAWLIYDLQRGSKWICVGVSHRQRFTSQSRYVNRDSRRNDQLVIGAGNTGLLRDEWTGIWLGKRSEEGQEVRVIRYGGSERVSPSSLVPITLDHLKEKHQAFFSLVSRVRLRRDSGMIDFPWGPESLEAALKRPLGDDWVIVTYEGLGFIGDR
jgi:hypothetical protein